MEEKLLKILKDQEEAREEKEMTLKTIEKANKELDEYREKARKSLDNFKKDLDQQVNFNHLLFFLFIFPGKL